MTGAGKPATKSFYGDEFTKYDPLPDGDTSAALRFLKRYCPEGPWVLTSIVPDGGTTTQTFAAADGEWQKAADWVAARQGKENVYFHVNPMLRALYNKASKEDVARLAWLYVDIDPRAGEDFEQERVRILGVLRGAKKTPTVIVDSGGGYQGFWKLHPSDKLEIGGKVSRAEELEAYNIQIEREFGGDHCHNVDRIMRLPGTINLPNLKKRAKGRRPAVSAVVEWNDVSYPIEQFTPAPRVQAPSAAEPLGGGRPKVAVPSGNLPDVGCDELREWAREHNKAISDHCLALIATGQDPVDPGKYTSRSEVLFKVCCDLVRAEVSDEMIFAVITGSNEIAASVRDKPNWERYALRQIERAKEEAIDPTLRIFNEKHAVIGDIGGKCRIISEVMDPLLKRTSISYQSFDDFRNRYRHIKVQIGVSEQGQPITKAAGAFWIDHPQRRQYDCIVFAPGQEVDEAYNLWKGFGCGSLPGDKHKSFLNHILTNVCKGNHEYYDYIVNWMALTVQHPDGPGEVAIVMRGKRGTGKGFFAKQFGRLWGRHFLQVANAKHLVGNFNAHLQDAVVVFGDEAFFAGDKQHESVLKTLITEETQMVERKGVDAKAASNFIHLIMASNDNWVVPAGLDERRFFVLEVGEGSKQDHQYFQNIREELDDGGLENLLHYLLTKDLSGYNVRAVPQTEALLEQKILSMSPETEWFYNLIWEGRALSTETEWPEKVVVETLYEDYLRRMDQQRRSFRLNLTSFGRFVTGMLPVGWPKKKREVCSVPWTNDHGVDVMISKRAYVYYLPTLDDVRAFWDKYHGGPFEWPKVEAAKLPLTEAAARPF